MLGDPAALNAAAAGRLAGNHAGGVLYFTDVVRKRSLRRRLLETDLALDPGHMFLGPVLFDLFRSLPAVRAAGISRAADTRAADPLGHSRGAWISPPPVSDAV